MTSSKRKWYIGYLSGNDGKLYPDVFTENATFHPNPDGGWGSYVRIQGPFDTKREARAVALVKLETGTGLGYMQGRKGF